MNFGERLKSLRMAKGITQQELADLMGVGRPTIAGYETKGKQPDFDKLRWLSSYFNVSIDFLLNDDSSTQNDFISKSIKSDSELHEFWEQIKDRENLQLLFKQTKNMDDKDIKQILRIIKAIEDEEDRHEGL